MRRQAHTRWAGFGIRQAGIGLQFFTKITAGRICPKLFMFV